MVYICGRGNIHGHAKKCQRRMLGIILYYSPLYSFETASLIEPGLGLVVNRPQKPSYLLELQEYMTTTGSLHGYCGFELRFLRLGSSLCYLLSHLPSTPIFQFKFMRLHCNLDIFLYVYK